MVPLVARKRCLAFTGRYPLMLLTSLMVAPVSAAAETDLELAPIEVTATGVIRDRAEAPMAVTVVDESALQVGREGSAWMKG